MRADADCIHPFCGWTGLNTECSGDPLQCPECGGPVKLFDSPSPSPTGRSEFAVTALGEFDGQK